MQGQDLVLPAAMSPASCLKKNPSQLNSYCRDSSTAHASQGSRSTLSPSPSNHAWLNEVPQDLPPPQNWVHQDLALPVSLVLRPALAEPLEISLCSSSEVCANQGTAGRGLKTQCLHIGGLFWKPWGIQATLYQGGQGNSDNHRWLEM